MAEFVGANLTKYNAPGGDNIIADGYIKTVEKVWLDSLAFTAVLTTADTVNIAVVPTNKKITGVEVYIPSTFAPTTATINVGTASEATKFINAAFPIIENSAAGAYGNLMKFSMNDLDGFQYVTTASTTIILTLGVTAMTAPTAGTIKTIVRYT